MGSFTLKSAITIKLEDGGTESLELKFYDDVPDLPAVMIDAPLRAILDRGNFSHVEEDDDSIDFPEVELTLDMVDSMVTSNKHAVEQWFNKHKTVDGSDLTSTNDGSAEARKTTDGSMVTIGIPSDIFTISLKILFDTGETGKAFGRHYKYFEPLEATVSSGQDAQVTLRGRLLGTYEEITTI